MNKKKKNKIAIIGSAGIPANYGGFETLAEQLVNYLGEDFNFTVYCSTKNYKQREKNYKNAKLKYISLNANGVQSIPYDIVSVLHAVFSHKTILMLGVSGALILPFLKIFTRRKYIVHLDGLEWKRDKWGKTAKKFLRLSESLSVKWADELIADNIEIQRYLEKEYGKSSWLIEYGADHVNTFSYSGENDIKFPEEYAFGVCRIEPENNIHLILEAFSQLPAVNLVMVGNWKNSNYGQNLLEKYKSCTNIYMVDPIYDTGKLNTLRKACLIYIHGHSAGGTNPSLVEAMYLSLPVIAFDVHYNRATTENKAMYFSDVSALKNLVETSSAFFTQNGKDMKAIAENRYIWQVVSQKYKSLLENTPE
nr:DUF1972 domain-containing protein [uncultured Fluviicola sp.]